MPWIKNEDVSCHIQTPKLFTVQFLEPLNAYIYPQVRQLQIWTVPMLKYLFLKQEAIRTNLSLASYELRLPLESNYVLCLCATDLQSTGSWTESILSASRKGFGIMILNV